MSNADVPIEAAARALHEEARADKLASLGAPPYDELTSQQQADLRESAARIVTAHREAARRRGALVTVNVRQPERHPLDLEPYGPMKGTR